MLYDPASELTATEQLKALRSDIHEIKHDIMFSRMRLENIDGRMKALCTDLVDLKNDFKQQPLFETKLQS